VSISPPSIESINDAIIAQLEVQFNQTIPLLPKAFNRVLARVLAATVVILYKYGGFIFLQMFVQTATINATEINGRNLSPLKEWGRLIGLGDPVAATQAELTVRVTVTNQVGQLNSGSQLVNNATGVTYITLATVLLNAATVDVTVRAVSDQSGGRGAGTIGNLDVGTELPFANPLANIVRTAVVVGAVTTGANGETTEAYRQRIIDRFQRRPQGGAYADYRLWGEEVAGIINCYPYTGSTPGTVEVYSEATVASSGNADGIPTAAQLQAVLDSIELNQAGLPTRRPANAFVYSFGITRSAFDVTVEGLAVDNLADVQADIQTGLEEYFLSVEPFIVGLSTLPRRDTVSQVGAGGVVSSVVTAAGGTVLAVTIELNGSNIQSYAVGKGEKAKLGSLSFV